MVIKDKQKADMLTLIRDVPGRYPLIYILLFLFPLMGAFARHWFSTFFILISLTSIYGLIRRYGTEYTPLQREEKIVLGGVALFFLAYFLPSVIHPFTINSLEVEIRYLLFIPIYLLVREMERPHLWLFFGLAAGAACIFGYAMYELLVVGIAQHSYKIHGAYINHYYGSIAVVTAFVALGSMYGLEKRLRWIFILAFCLGLVSAILSGARGSYVMAFSVAVLWGYLRLKTRIFIMFIGLITIVVISLYSFSTNVKYQIDRAIDDVKYYFILDEFSEVELEARSASVRLELWAHSLSIIADHPLLGIGRGNFEDVVRGYMTEDQKEDPLLVHSHPHNAYLEVLVSKGLIGGLAFAMMFFYPMVIFFRDYRKSADTSLPGIMLLSTFFVYSLSEVPFIKGNGTAVYLILLAVTFSYHIKQSRTWNCQDQME